MIKNEFPANLKKKIDTRILKFFEFKINFMSTINNSERFY